MAADGSCERYFLIRDFNLASRLLDAFLTTWDGKLLGLPGSAWKRSMHRRKYLYGVSDGHEFRAFTGDILFPFHHEHTSVLLATP